MPKEKRYRIWRSVTGWQASFDMPPTKEMEGRLYGANVLAHTDRSHSAAESGRVMSVLKRKSARYIATCEARELDMRSEDAGTKAGSIRLFATYNVTIGRRILLNTAAVSTYTIPRQSKLEFGRSLRHSRRM